MLTIISPAKTLDYETPVGTTKSSKPGYLKESAELIDILRDYSPDDLVELMAISHKLGELNHQRFHNWTTPFNKANARQAIYAFKGDVYTGLDAKKLNEEDLEFAQNHLRILSGLYGLLRPLDLMQPYRLEMGTKLSNDQGANLYEFWGDKLTKAVNKQLKSVDSEVLINLASNEYSKSLPKESLKAEVITPVFKDLKNGKYKVVSFFAKKARGLMSAYIIKNKITDPEKIKRFKVAGYRFDRSQSSPKEWVFLRDEPQ